MSSSPASRIQANLQELFQADLTSGEAYVRFQLTTEVESSFEKSSPEKTRMTSNLTALLSMEQVQESLVIEVEKITPLPSMPESLIGIMASHNRVFCVFDLAQLLRLRSPSISPRQHQIIVFQTTSENPIYVGLAVTNLRGIVRLATEKIQSSPEGLPSNLIPYVSGAVEFNKTITPILDFNRISEVLVKLNNN